jgi:hypothetical protein
MPKRRSVSLDELGRIRRPVRDERASGIGRTSPGFSAPMPGIRAPRPRTRSIAPIWRAARPAFRSPSICRPRPATTAIIRWRGRGRQGRRADRPSGRYAGAVRRHSARRMNTSMTINAPAALAAGALHRLCRRAGRRPPALQGTTQNDIIKEYLRAAPTSFRPPASLKLTGDVIAFTYRRIAEMESGQSLLLSSAGGRRRRRCRRRPSRLANAAPCSTPAKAGGHAGGRIRPKWSGASASSSMPASFVTEMCKMRAMSSSGTRCARPLRHRGSEAPPLSLRRAGQFAGPDRAAAGEQRLSHPVRHAGVTSCRRTPAPAPCNCRPGTRRWACRGPGTSNGACACSRSSPSRPICWNMAICSTARR